MNRNKWIILALAIAAAASMAFVFLIAPNLGGLNLNRQTSAGFAAPRASKTDELPRIAVLSPNLAEKIQSESKQDLANLLQSGADKEATTNTVATLMRVSTDLLYGKIMDQISQTQRFAVSDPSSVRRAVQVMSARDAPPDAGGAQKRPDDFSALLSAFNKASVTSTSAAGKVTIETANSNPVAQDLVRAGKELGANYVLVVAVSEPRVTIRTNVIPDTTIVQRVLSAQPIFNYSLLDVATGAILLSRVAEPPEAIEIAFDSSITTPESAMDRINMRLFETVARAVANDIVDTVAPMQISSVRPDLIVIDRGERDGVQIGDEFDVSRAVGGASGANAVTLAEAVREPVGRVRVIRIQTNLAHVEAIRGELRSGDVVEISGTPYAARRRTTPADPAAAAPVAGTPDAPAPALGVRAMAREDSAPARPKIAVRNLALSYASCANCPKPEANNRALNEAFLSALQNENRIAVFTRIDANSAVQERQFTDAANGRMAPASIAGMEGADYLLTGSFVVVERKIAASGSIAGKPIGGGSALAIDGQVRIFSVRTGEQIEASQISATSPGPRGDIALTRLAAAAAEKAVAALSNRLFPLAVNAKVSDTQIELTGGQSSGLRNGMRVRVFSVGAPVQDLYSSATSTARRYVGDLVVVDARRDSATARFAGKPFDVKRGDQLEIGGTGSGGAPSAGTAPATQASPPDRF